MAFPARVLYVIQVYLCLWFFAAGYPIRAPPPRTLQRERAPWLSTLRYYEFFRLQSMYALSFCNECVLYRFMN